MNPQPKSARWENKKYLAFVRTLPSIVPGSGDIVPHHVRMDGNAGVAGKPSDYYSVPLADSKHKELDQIGKESFYKKYDINIYKEIMLVNQAWIRYNN